MSKEIKKEKMKKVTITLTEKEVETLYQLVSESCDTGNDEWDITMVSIERKLHLKMEAL